MDELSAKRFVRSLRYAMEVLANDAKCYRYEHTPEYLEVKEDLKFAIRMLEEGEGFAGALTYKNAKQIPMFIALDMARKAKTDEERNFFAYVSDMNMQRAQRKVIQEEQERFIREQQHGQGPKRG